MTGVPVQKPRDSLVLVWVREPDTEFDYSMEDGNNHSQPTIMIISCYDEQTLRKDKYSQQAAWKLQVLQSKSGALTIDELTDGAKKVISKLNEDIPRHEYPWLVKDANTARVCSSRGLAPRSLWAIAPKPPIESLGSMAEDTEMTDAWKDRSCANDLTQAMSLMDLKGQESRGGSAA